MEVRRHPFVLLAVDHRLAQKTILFCNQTFTTTKISSGYCTQETSRTTTINLNYLPIQVGLNFLITLTGQSLEAGQTSKLKRPARPGQVWAYLKAWNIFLFSWGSCSTVLRQQVSYLHKRFLLVSFLENYCNSFNFSYHAFLAAATATANFHPKQLVQNTALARLVFQKSFKTILKNC